MSEFQPPNIDEIKRQSVVRFLAEMQGMKQKIELEFASRFDEQKNNFLATSKSSYSPKEIGTIFDTIKTLELDYMKNILTNASGNGSKILGNTLSSALTGNLTFTGEASQRIAELEQERNRLKAELFEKAKTHEQERQKNQARGENQTEEMNRLQELTDEQKRTIETYEKQVMEYGETLAQQRIEIEDLQSQLGDISVHTESSDKILNEKEEIIEEQKKNIAAQKEQIASMEKRIQQMKSVSSDKFQAETTRLESTLGRERERADDLEIRLKETSTAITSYKKAVEQKDEEITRLRKTITENKAEIASAGTEKDAHIKTLNDEVRNLQNQLSDNKTSLTRNEKKIATLDTEIKEKAKIIDTQEVEMRNLKGQVTDFKEKATTDKNSQETRLNELLKSKTTSEADINNLKKEVRELQKVLSDKEKTITEITKTQNVIEQDREAIQDERDKIMVQYENIKTKTVELDKSLAQKETLIKSLTKSLQGIPKFRVFLAIQDIGGEITISDLAKIVGQTQDVVEHIISDLKNDGLVKVVQKGNKSFVSKV